MIPKARIDSYGARGEFWPARSSLVRIRGRAQRVVVLKISFAVSAGASQWGK